MSAVQQKPERTPQDSQQIEFPPDSPAGRIKKWGGIAGIVFGLVASIWGAQSWFTSTIEASAVEVETRVNTRVDEKFDAHAAHPHSDSVPREVYENHVADFKDADAAAKAERKEIKQLLDLIGKETYRSPAKWERTLEREGLEAPAH